MTLGSSVMIQKIQLQETLLQEYSDLEPMFYNFCVLLYPKCIVSLHKAGLVDLEKSHLFNLGFMLHVLANNYMKHDFFFILGLFVA